MKNLKKEIEENVIRKKFKNKKCDKREFKEKKDWREGLDAECKKMKR